MGRSNGRNKGGYKIEEKPNRNHQEKIQPNFKNKLKVNLLEMDAQHLDFPDNIFDFVVSTCVFCSFPDPVAGLKELFRVCKPNGKVLMLEHMRSEHPFVGKIMDLLNPLTVRMTGANINRRTLDHIERAGLLIEENEKLFFTIFRKLELRPNKGEEDE